MFRRFGQLFSIKAQKVAHFVKNNEKSSIWPKVATFRGNYHVSAFWSAFQQKNSKSGSFCQKAAKNIDLAKTCNFSSILHCFSVLVNFSAKTFKAHFVKKNEKSLILPKVEFFRGNYHISAFWSTFKQRCGKTGSFREKARKIIDLAKTSNFSKQQSCFVVSVKFSGKNCRKWFTS